MIDVDELLVTHGREWRAEQPPLPPVTVAHMSGQHRRSRWALVAAALVVVLGLGAAAFIATRPDPSTPTINAPPTTPSDVVPDVAVPTVDVVPLFLPVDAADISAAGSVLERLAFRTTGDQPSHRQIVHQQACNLALLGTTDGRYGGFEDPASYLGQPVTPTVATPDPPATLRCTKRVASAAARIREIVTALDWYRLLDQTDSDTTIKAAQQQDLACLAEHGILGVTEAFIADPNGSNQAHPEWSGQTATFAECFEPVTAARAPLREAFRATFMADHPGEIQNLQRAFDDYLRAIYTATPDSPTVATAPDLARFAGGCIRVINPDADPPRYSNDAALAFAHRALGDPRAPASRTILGRVSVCDRRSLGTRLAWTFEFPGNVVVVDARTGKVILKRAVTGS